MRQHKHEDAYKLGVIEGRKTRKEKWTQDISPDILATQDAIWALPDGAARARLEGYLAGLRGA